MVHFSRGILLSLLAFVVCVSPGCQVRTDIEPVVADQSPDIGIVKLEILFNSDREDILSDVPCSAESTVWSVLERARDEGDLEFESTGQTAEYKFVTSIGGLKNQASAGDNWVYRVNGVLGDKSSGLYPVNPGDHVIWVFGKYSAEDTQ